MWHKLIVAGFFLVSVTLVGAQSAALGLSDEIAEYFGWERANAQKSLEESAHPIAKDIYFNDSAAESVGSRSFPHAEGSIFVKESVNPEMLSFTVVSAMRKVAGFNPDGGDWQYGMFERQDDGSFAGDWMSASEAAMCSECHSSAADSDYTFLSYLTE